jgi:Tol biopolymer transport system component
MLSPVQLRAAAIAGLLGLVFFGLALGARGDSSPHLTQTERIVFDSSRAPGGLYSMAPDGSDVRPLPGGANGFFARWSPDGEKIAFMRATDGNLDVYSMNVDGSGLTRLTNDPGFDGYADWSPDGTRLAFVRSAGIFVMNVDGSDVTYLRPGSKPSWSPDSSKIVFEDAFDIYMMNADGSELVRITYSTAPEYHPAWSPDGAQIAFVRDIPGPWWNWLVIMVKDLATGQERQIGSAPPPGSHGPSWSPDSSRVVFHSAQDNNLDIYSVNRDGTGG